MDDDACIERTQFLRKLRIAIDITFGKPHGKGIVRTFDETLFLQTLPERCNSTLSDPGIRFEHQQKPDQRHVRFLLGMARSRNTQRGRTCQSDELTPSHQRPQGLEQHSSRKRALGKDQ